jgi:hypothetical protein
MRLSMLELTSDFALLSASMPPRATSVSQPRR